MRWLVLISLVACGRADRATGTADGGLGGGDASPATTDTGGGNGRDAGSGDGGTTGDPIPLVACGSPVEVDTTLATALDMTSLGTFQPAPWLLAGDDARVFYTSTAQIMTAHHGSATTAAWPASLQSATYAYGEHSISGSNVVIFISGAQAMASIDFAAPIAIPCTLGDVTGGECDVRAAGDGHLWVRSGAHLYEQTGAMFADRGGAPAYPALFQVLPDNDVLVGAESFAGDEVFAIWKLPNGAGGWTKTGSLTTTTIGSAAAAIEGGFQLDPAIGTFAQDGSIHLLSSSRCVGTGERNKTQLYLRSRDGVTWDVETLPDIGTFTDGQVTWYDEAVWAHDYDNVRFVNESSPTPIENPDGTYSYPDRQLNAIARCLDHGQPAFERIAEVRVPGWTVRGLAGFSETGVVTFATTLGLTQAYR